MIWTILTIFFPLLLIVGVPVAIGLGITAMASLLIHTDIPLVLLPQRFWVMLDSFTLLAVPYFILAGTLMERGGMSARLIRFAVALIGRVRGGYGLATIFSSMVFAGISGSGTADTAAVGSLMIPSLIRRGYPRGYAAALQAAAGALGPIFPPSILMILYASLVSQSPARMFAGAVVPALIMSAGLMVLVYIYSVRRGIPVDSGAWWSEVRHSLRDAGWALITPLIVLGGILLGVFTPTEAGIAAVIWALLMGFVVYRELHLRDLPGIVIQAAITTTLVMFVVGVAGVFTYILALSGVPLTVADSITRFTSSPVVAAALVVAFLLLAGGFVELAVLLLIFVPVFHPLGARFGFDPLQWSVALCITLVVGAVHPPIADFLFISTALAETTVRDSTRYIWPFVGWMIVVIALCLAVPDVVLALPRLIMK